jgi:hypothetical protein
MVKLHRNAVKATHTKNRLQHQRHVPTHFCQVVSFDELWDIFALKALEALRGVE